MSVDPEDREQTLTPEDRQQLLKHIERCRQAYQSGDCAALLLALATAVGAETFPVWMTKEQQAELIFKTIEAGKPIDRATVARSFNPTPGQKGGSTKDPVLAAAIDEGKKHDISERTMKRAHAKVQGKQPAPRKPSAAATTAAATEARRMDAFRTFAEKTTRRLSGQRSGDSAEPTPTVNTLDADVQSLYEQLGQYFRRLTRHTVNGHPVSESQLLAALRLYVCHLERPSSTQPASASALPTASRPPRLTSHTMAL